MGPLADTHVHLLASRDDGPPTMDVAVAMCRMLASEGAGHATALAHQNVSFPDNTPDNLIAAAAKLSAILAVKKVPLAVYPAAEVMLTPALVDDWTNGKLLSIGNYGHHILVEMPYGGFLDALPFAEKLRPLGVHLAIAHGERYPQLLHDNDLAAKWLAAGCLIQVTAQAIAEPWDDEMEPGLAAWARGGFIHLLGSDGHGIDRRQPMLAAGYRRLRDLAGRAWAKRVGCEWGTAFLRGGPLVVPPPHPPARAWFTRPFGR